MYMVLLLGLIDAFLLAWVTWVDDLLVSSGLSKASDFTDLLEEIKQHIVLTMKGIPRHFVGLDFEYTNTSLILSQKLYDESLPACMWIYLVNYCISAFAFKYNE